MAARWAALIVWLAVAANAAYWGLKLFVRPQPVPEQASMVAGAALARSDLTRVLGVDTAPAVTEAAPPPEEPPADTRLQLVGVVAAHPSRPGAPGVALISVDGRPARAYRVGAVVDGDRVLQSVKQREALLGPRGGTAQVALSLPPPAPPATGVPPSLGGGPASGFPAPRAPGPQGEDPSAGEQPGGNEDAAPAQAMPMPMPIPRRSPRELREATR